MYIKMLMSLGNHMWVILSLYHLKVIGLNILRIRSRRRKNVEKRVETQRFIRSLSQAYR